MKMLGDLRALLLGLASTTAFLGQVDARDIIRHAVVDDERNWHKLPEAFEFRLAGEARLDGHSIFIIEAMPRQGYQPRSRTAISVGLFLVRVAKGSRATLELTSVGDGVWLPERLQGRDVRSAGLNRFAKATSP